MLFSFHLPPFFRLLSRPPRRHPARSKTTLLLRHFRSASHTNEHELGTLGGANNRFPSAASPSRRWMEPRRRRETLFAPSLFVQTEGLSFRLLIVSRPGRARANDRCERHSLKCFANARVTRTRSGAGGCCEEKEDTHGDAGSRGDKPLARTKVALTGMRRALRTLRGDNVRAAGGPRAWEIRSRLFRHRVGRVRAAALLCLHESWSLGARWICVSIRLRATLFEYAADRPSPRSPYHLGLCLRGKSEGRCGATPFFTGKSSQTGHLA